MEPKKDQKKSIVNLAFNALSDIKKSKKGQKFYKGRLKEMGENEKKRAPQYDEMEKEIRSKGIEQGKGKDSNFKKAYEDVDNLRKSHYRYS